MENNAIISAKNIYLSYNADEPIIKNATFRINKKDFVFITGPSGSGKTTLLKSFYGGLKIRSGALNVCGISVDKHIKTTKLNILRRYLGIVFQDYKLISEWSVEKNIMLPLLINGYPKDICKSQVEKLLAHVKLTHKTKKYPLELSGGEQQRVAMARALSHNPLMILADEPTGNLDDYSSDVIWNLLKSANEQLGVTIVVVTHRVPSQTGLSYRQFSIEDSAIHELS